MQKIEKSLKYFFDCCLRRSRPKPEGSGLLAQDLNMFDVTFLCIGNTIGMGTYVFVARFTVTIGPALLITNIFTAGLIFISALCYAQFTTRESNSGGPYSCAYQHMGELHAVVVGSLLSIEHVFAAALASRGLSIMIDEFFNNQISKAVKNYMTFSNPLLGEFPDVLGAMIPIVCLGIVSFEVKTVININNICCLVNLGLFVLTTLVTGSNLDFKNWSIPPSESCGNGGFLPYGMYSVLLGIPRVYSPYIGFDAAGHTGGEVKEPERIIPLSMIVAVTIVSGLYTLHTFTYTLVWSYCDQDVDDPIPVIMEHIGMDIMKWITWIALPIGMMGNFICNTYPLSRLIYSMADDGLLYSWLGKINVKTRTPMNAIYMSGILTGLFALFIDLIQLAQLSCIGAQLAYILISYCLLILSYSDDDMEYGSTSRRIYQIILNTEPEADTPTVITSSIVRVCCWTTFITSFPFLLITRYGSFNLIKGKPVEVILISSIVFIYVFIFCIILRQPKSKSSWINNVSNLWCGVFSKMKIVPLLPMCIILVNTYLCMEYNILSWLHTGIWICIALVVYFTHGIRNSRAPNRPPSPK